MPPMGMGGGLGGMGGGLPPSMGLPPGMGGGGLPPGMGGGGLGGGMIPPAMPTQGGGVDPAMLAAMTGPTTMAPQPIDPAILDAILSMIGPGGGTVGAPVGPTGMPAAPAPPGQGGMMSPWQQALMGSGPGPGGGAAGIRGLPPTPRGY